MLSTEQFLPHPPDYQYKLLFASITVVAGSLACNDAGFGRIEGGTVDVPGMVRSVSKSCRKL